MGPSGYPLPTPLVALAVVPAVVAGFGVWAWQDDTSILAQMTGRSRGHRALASMMISSVIWQVRGYFTTSRG
ncbi:hypothetical protein [Nocardia arizonensis]|uniref:hypothetical protein n=1 Tax=Nocardia arizonensis TaxID=1141647 RepID=UPI0006D196CD|nr:hypothetical protein [Nocardia arizonensis]